MTDATHAVTQSALEYFASAYLHGLGASIRQDNNQWHVRLPSHVDVDFTEQSEFELVLVEEGTSQDGPGYTLTPESEFTQQLLDEAADIAPVGQIALTEEMTDSNYQFPPWVTESRAGVTEAAFTPYYDRTAVCVFVRIGIETVSEYQTQFLEAVAVDVESQDRLSGIEQMLVTEFFSAEAIQPNNSTEHDSEGEISVSPDKLGDTITHGQQVAVEEVQQKVQDVRQSASRAADSEFEEYKQLQEQRINDFQEEISSRSNRLQNLAKKVDGADSQRQRVEALEKRKEIKAEVEDLETELADIIEKKERGYSQKRQKIFERHAIELNTKPIAVTLVSYERGEIELTLTEGGQTQSMRVPYAIGGGVTNEVNCPNCNEELSIDNPVRVIEESTACQTCR